MLTKIGLDGQSTASIAVENGSIVLRKCAKAVRVGWTDAAAAIAANGGDALLLGNFSNEEETGLDW